jgi:hypothetical protein
MGVGTYPGRLVRERAWSERSLRSRQKERASRGSGERSEASNPQLLAPLLIEHSVGSECVYEVLAEVFVTSLLVRLTCGIDFAGPSRTEPTLSLYIPYTRSTRFVLIAAYSSIACYSP